MPERTGCLICGEDIEYLETPEQLKCEYCGREYEAESRCRSGHYVCDACHRLSAEDLIEQFCRNTHQADPLEMAQILMRNPSIAMHGPEHHFLVTAVLLTSYSVVTGRTIEKERWLRIARQRASMIKGGFCGIMGDCGAAVGTGIFVSIITSATPLSVETWQQANLMTAESLRRIALAGGPRCCKRNSFLAILTATDFVKEHFGIVIPVQVPSGCEWSPINKECRGVKCPFYSVNDSCQAV